MILQIFDVDHGSIFDKKYFTPSSRLEKENADLRSQLDNSKKGLQSEIDGNHFTNTNRINDLGASHLILEIFNLEQGNLILLPTDPKTMQLNDLSFNPKLIRHCSRLEKKMIQSKAI